MVGKHPEGRSRKQRPSLVGRTYRLLTPRAYTAILFGALFCTLAVKLFHAIRCNLIRDYPGWIWADISVLLGIEVILALICFRWSGKWVLRAATLFAGLVCTWSVMNAGWLIRTGTQILPTELLPLIRDPLNISAMVVVNMARMPKASLILLTPSAVAITFWVYALAKPLPPAYNKGRFVGKVVISVGIVLVAGTAHATAGTQRSWQAASAGLRYNCQSRAVMMFILPELRHVVRADFTNATRQMPLADELVLKPGPQAVPCNIVIVVLEGIQYRHTSFGAPLAEPAGAHARPDPTPYLTQLARHGLSCCNARSTVTHTTKALFALLTGCGPSASQDIAETVPVERPYAGLPTILKRGLGYRTAFFQSAKGTFESRPGLVHNLGFDKFWAREDIGEPNAFVGYLGSDEFAMLGPIADWIKAEDKPFLIAIMCSVTHDPYEVPQWYGQLAREPVDKYAQAISYTDKFIEALDVELATLGQGTNTIFVVVGDHGEGFGEHGMLGHERIAFDEVLRIPLVLRAPFLVEPGTRVAAPVSSVDLTPTLLSLLGFAVEGGQFDGVNILAGPSVQRKIRFSGWMREGPAGYVQGDRKFVHDPSDDSVAMYDVRADPSESIRIFVPAQQSERIAEDIISWRKGTIFRLEQARTGQTTLFDSWLCKWTGRVSTVRYRD